MVNHAFYVPEKKTMKKNLSSFDAEVDRKIEYETKCIPCFVLLARRRDSFLSVLAS